LVGSDEHDGGGLQTHTTHPDEVALPLRLALAVTAVVEVNASGEDELETLRDPVSAARDTETQME
jgi:hypothetical protein